MNPGKRIPTLTPASSLILVLLLWLIPAMTRAESAAEAWVRRADGQANAPDVATAMAVDGSNNIVVTGYSLSRQSAYDYMTIRYSCAGVPLWTNRYLGPTTNDDRALAIAVDGDNNVVVTGQTGTSGGNPDYDFATIKYSSAGAPLWTNYYNGPANQADIARAAAVDGSNNVIIAGGSYGSGSDSDLVVIKYSSDGTPLWTNRYNGPGNGFDCAYAVAVDSLNNIIVTGGSFGSGGNDDYATIKYSSEGAQLWLNRYNGPGDGYDDACQVKVDGANNVIVTGTSGEYSSVVATDYATIKYASAGMPLWTNRYNGPGLDIDRARGLAVDGDGNAIVTGTSAGFNVGYEYATIKYSSAGTPLWTNRYNAIELTFASNDAKAVAVDHNNNVIVTGISLGSTLSYDYATIKYSSAGAPLWTNRYNGPANDYDLAIGVVVDRNDDVVVTGTSTGTGSYYDYATIKYFSAGAPLLNITRMPADAVLVSWPAPAEGWVLECTNTLTEIDDAWPQMLPPYQSNETLLWATFTNSPPPGSQYYRLRKQ